MKLLLLEYEQKATPLLAELCRDSTHHLLVCRTACEAAQICREHCGGFDWIIVSGAAAAEKSELARMLRGTGCKAPVVFWSSGVTAATAGEQPGHLVHHRRLTRLDLQRLLTQPGGVFEDQEVLFEYHAPHPVNVAAPRKKRRTL